MEHAGTSTTEGHLTTGGEVDDETTTYVSETTAEQVNSDVRVLSRDREFDVM